MISIRSLSLPIFALVATLAGCSADGGTAPGAENTTASQSKVVAQAEPATADGHHMEFHHRMGGPGGPGGPEMLIGAALRAPIDLTAEQRTTIEGLGQGSHPERMERHTLDATKAKELAAAIRAGNVASLPKPTFDESKMKEHLAASATALKTLHDTLTAAQRTALVEDIKSHAPKGEHKVEIKIATRGPHGGEMPFGDDLGLTDAQKEQLKTKMEANHPVQPSPAQITQMKADMAAKLDSFKSDSFDANAFVAPPANRPSPSEMMKGNPLADLVSVLTPEQREILAKRIEAGPPAR